MPETTEYKDNRNENRIRHKADNGRITYASTQGYQNIQDMRDAAIYSSIDLLKNYWEKMSIAQKATIENFIKNNPS